MDKLAYKNSLKKQLRNKKTRLCCVECGEDGPATIEMHHIYGRNNSDETIPLCKNCHSKITSEQNKVDPKKRSKNATSLEQRGFWFISIGALIKGIGDELLNYGHEVMDYE